MAVASPIVPQPNTANFSWGFGWPLRAALHPTVKGSIKQATLSEIFSSTVYNEKFRLALGIFIYSENPPIVPALFVSPVAKRGYG